MLGRIGGSRPPCPVADKSSFAKTCFTSRMNTSPSELHFRSSGTKLLPAVIVAAAFAIPMIFVSVALFAARLIDSVPLTVGAAVVELLVHALTGVLLWCVLRTVRRMISPDEVRLDACGMSVTELGSTVRHPWHELGRPEAVYGSSDSRARTIRIPVLGIKQGKLMIAAEQYCHSVEDMLLTIENARNGVLDALPPEQSLASYRYFAIPMALVTFAVIPVFAAYVSRQ